MDDGYACGPPGIVFDAVAQFAEAVADVGLELRVDKCRCFSLGLDLQTFPGRPPHMPVGSLAAPDGRVGYGVLVGGVPVGDEVFVRTFLDGRVQKTTSKINHVVSQLRDLHLPSVWT
eukprot:8401393-Karenia_brevis.AAC.1